MAFQRIDLVKAIVQPGDCGKPADDLSVLLGGAALFTSPLAALGLFASAIAVQIVSAGPCLSKIRLTAILNAGQQNLVEALPALIVVLGGEFVEGVQTLDAKRTVIFRMNPALRDGNATTRAVAAAAIAKILTQGKLAGVPPEMIIAALTVVDATATRDPSAETRKIARQAKALIDPVFRVPPTARASKLPWILVGVTALGAGVFKFLAWRHERRPNRSIMTLRSE